MRSGGPTIAAAHRPGAGGRAADGAGGDRLGGGRRPRSWPGTVPRPRPTWALSPVPLARLDGAEVGLRAGRRRSSRATAPPDRVRPGRARRHRDRRGAYRPGSPRWSAPPARRPGPARSTPYPPPMAQPAERPRPSTVQRVGTGPVAADSARRIGLVGAALGARRPGRRGPRRGRPPRRPCPAGRCRCRTSATARRTGSRSRSRRRRSRSGWRRATRCGRVEGPLGEARRRRDGRRRRRPSACPVSGCTAVDSPPMSHRSQVANSGSRPIAACSAACRAPGTSGRRDAGRGERLRRDGPPDRHRAQLPRRQVERHASRAPRR